MITGVNFNLLVYRFDEENQVYKVVTCLEHPIYVEYCPKYNELSTMKIVVEKTSQNSNLQKHDILQIENGRFGEIKTIEIQSGENKISISGDLCDGIIKKRCTTQDFEFIDEPLSDVFRDILSDISTIPLLEYSISVPTIDVEGEQTVITYSGTIKQGNAFDIIQDLCREHNLGFKTEVAESLNSEERLGFTFSIYSGEDKSDTIIMSEDYGTIVEFEHTLDYREEVNSVTVLGKDTSVTIQTGAPTDMTRYEYVVHCTGLDPTGYTAAEYHKLLVSKGKEVLQAYIPQLSYSGKFYEKSYLQPFIDFDVGDIVGVKDLSSQIETTQIISGIMLQYDSRGKYTQLLFGTPKKTVSGILSSNSGKIIKETVEIKEVSSQSSGVGRNVGNHNEIFNVNEGEADSSTINGDSRYDYNHATGRGHTINGSNNTSVGGYHNSVSGGYCLNVYGTEITVTGLNPRCSWIAGDTLTVQGSGITSSVIVGQSSTVSTSNCQANIISVFSGTIGGDIYSSIIETQNSTVLSMDSSIFVGKYSNIGGYIFCSGIFGYDHAISTAYQALVSGRGASVTNSTRMAIGNGTKQSPENIFHIDASGNVTAESYNTNSADFAEMFEWADGNRENADRRGMLVALYGDMILPAHGDDFFGIVSAAPSVIGNNPQHWHKRHKKDVFGAEIRNEKGERIESDEYDPKQEYIPRSERPEWAAVGLTGRLIITDDGSCKVGGYVSARHGVGTKCYSKTAAKVLKRIDDHHVEVLLIAR